MIPQKRTVLLMTGCVNPGKMPHTVLVNKDRREQQYISAIHFYLNNTPFKIIFVENTGTDLSCFFKESIAEYRCEFITFYGNYFDKKFGKGYGEGIILKEAFERSHILNKETYILKVSGRYVISNIQELLHKTIFLKKTTNRDILCNINPWRRGGGRYASSVIFGADYTFYKNYFLMRINQINESKGIWFEHVLYDSIKVACQIGRYKLLNFPIPIIKEVESGSTGSAFNRPNVLVYWAYHIKFLCYKFHIVKL